MLSQDTAERLRIEVRNLESTKDDLELELKEEEPASIQALQDALEVRY